MTNTMHARPVITGDTITYDCTITGPWQEAFLRSPQSGDLAKTFGVRWPQVDTYSTDVSDVPPSIAIIPLLTNVLPIAWAYGATVTVDEVDETFFAAQESLKRAFASYYPALPVSGGLVSKRLMDNTFKDARSPPLVLFSGGVDANFSLYGNMAVRPHIVTVRGADVYFSDEDAAAWDIIKERHQGIADGLGVPFHSIESSFKIWLANWKLHAIAKQAGGWNWWFNQQQGAALTGLCAPLAWELRTKRVIISSSFSCHDRVHTPCGSNPLTDESIRYGSTSVTHYDFTVPRQAKVRFLVEEARLRQHPISLRVCWQQRTGHNCCSCEKCLRTIFAILAENGNPRAFGFDVASEDLIHAVTRPEFRPGVFWGDVFDRLRGSPAEDTPAVRALLSRRQEAA